MDVKASVLSQLRDFSAWSNGNAALGPISLFDYAGFVATADILFAFAELFCPNLVVHDELRFLASGFSVETYESWVQQGVGPEGIQRVMNHVHVSVLLQDQEVSDEMAEEAARVLSVIWGRTLAPEGLEVEVVGEGFADAAVTFFEARCSE